MDVFVIHSGSDRAMVDKEILKIRKNLFSFNTLVLNNGGRFWKGEAKQKIKRAQMVVFFVGESSYKSQNIDWEIRTAIKYKKPIYAVRLNESNVLNESLNVFDGFSGTKQLYCKETTLDEIVDVIKNYNAGNYDVFNQDIANIDKEVLLEQYKVFLKTSEDLVARRQSVNNFYISVNSALMGALGMIWALDILSIYKLFVGILLAIVGIVLSISWIKLLSSYGDLNGSKMKIISYIEKQLPASLYDAEWQALSDKLNKKKYVSFTNSEKRIPYLFIAVYVCALACGVAFML